MLERCGGLLTVGSDATSDISRWLIGQLLVRQQGGLARVRRDLQGAL